MPCGDELRWAVHTLKACSPRVEGHRRPLKKGCHHADQLSVGVLRNGFSARAAKSNRFLNIHTDSGRNLFSSESVEEE